MHRFLLCSDLAAMLKKKAFQTSFLDMDGLGYLDMWLNVSNDFPPLQVIETVFDVLESLPVDEESLSNCDIAKTLQYYAGSREYNGVTIDIVKRATHLL